VARVLHRVFAPEVAPKSGRGLKALWAIAEQLLPRTGRSTWTHNQALMELGALVCTARAPKCGGCPVRAGCRSVDAVARGAAGDRGATPPPAGGRSRRRSGSPPA
jgi:A/G-specific adenine glycosylase